MAHRQGGAESSDPVIDSGAGRDAVAKTQRGGANTWQSGAVGLSRSGEDAVDALRSDANIWLDDEWGVSSEFGGMRSAGHSG